MAQQGYSKSQEREAERLVAVADKWAEGYDKRSGVRFNLFASKSTPGAVYRTRIDGQGCTCPGARHSRSGGCVHQLACAIVTERVREQAARPSKRYEDIWTDDVLGLVDAF